MQRSITPRDRDAYTSIRGYRYQVDMSLVRWLDLQPGEVLELEAGEDIDQISEYLSAEGVQQQRLFEQIKHRQGESLTMRSPEAIAAIVNFYVHRATYPEQRLLFRYTTNASFGRERRSPMPNKMPALQAWEQIRQGLLRAPLLDQALAGIRYFLDHAGKPEDIGETLWSQFCADLQQWTSTNLLDFIQAFEWSNQAADVLDLRQILHQRLLDEGYAVDLLQAERRYEHLFLYVLHLLSQADKKLLTIEDRQTHLTLPVLGDEERRQLQALLLKVPSLEYDIAELQRGAAEQRKTMAQFNARVQQLAGQQEVDVAVLYTSKTPNLSIPPLVEHLSHRPTAVKVLRTQVMTHDWTALRGNAAVGKTQLAILLAHQVEMRCIWIDFGAERSIEQCCVRLDAACSSLFAQKPSDSWSLWYPQLPQQLGSPALVVLDSLPQLSGRDSLSERLLALTTACQGTGIRLLSISMHPLPKYLQDRFRSRNLYKTIVPPFSNQEVAEMLRTYDAPASIDEHITAIGSLGRRHPLLVQAIIEYLQSLDWQLTDEAYRALFSQAHAAEVNAETLTRLIHTIHDQSSRDLLYRLSLIAHAFSLEEVQALAQVSPSIAYPHERLQPLIGPWVEHDQNNMYRVSPLIHTLGSDLTPQTRRACHEVLAESLLHKGRVSPGEVGEAIVYLLGAERFKRAGWLFLQALMDINRQPRLVHDMGLLAFWTEEATPLPPQIDLGCRLYIRAQQILAWQKRGRETTYLVHDLRWLMTQASEQEAWAIVGILITAPQALANVHHAFQLVLHAGPLFASPEGASPTLQPPLEVEPFIWVTGFQVKRADELLDWLETIEQLSVHQRRRAFQEAAAEQGCLITIDSVWWYESEKPAAEQRWGEVFAALQHVAERALQLDLELLWACAVRASIIVLAGYQKQLTQAVLLAEQALARASADPRVHFLIEECTGRQYFDQHQEQEALRWLQRALEKPTTAYTSLRLFGLLYASQCIGKQDVQAAISYAQQGVDVGMASPDVSELDVVKAWGELTMAHWLGNERLAAFNAWDQAGKRLLACRADTVQWKSLFRAYGHASGYFAVVVKTGQPPMALQDGQPYAAPTRGLLVASRPQLAAGYDPANDAILFVQLAAFAEALGQDDRAVEWAEQGIDIALATRQTAAYLQLSNILVPSLIKQDKYEDALESALEAGVISKALSLHHNAGGNILSPDLDVRTILGSKPNEQWDDAEYQAAQKGLFPCVFRLGLLTLTSPEIVQDHVTNVITLCQKIDTTASNHPLWRGCIRLLEQSFLEHPGEQVVSQTSNAFESVYRNVPRYMGYVGATLQSDGSLLDAYTAHALAARYASGIFDRSSTTHRGILLPFIRTYWLSTFQNKRAFFSNPSQVEKDLQAASDEPEQNQVRAILTAIAYGVGGDVGLLPDV